MTETIKLKEQRIGELGILIDMGAKAVLTKEQRAKTLELYDRMTYRTKALLDEFREKELTTKIEVMEQILKIYKNK